MIRAVIDLNVIISGLIVPRGFAYHVWSAWLARRFTLVISEGMILELVGKLAERRISERYGVTPQEIHYISSLLRGHGSLVAVPDDAITPVTGDPEDDLVLASARVAHADYLVTRDQKLLDLGQHGGVCIVTPYDFLPLLASDR
jgi:putative PIN family toxin of toxin-antitoxin system